MIMSTMKRSIDERPREGEPSVSEERTEETQQTETTAKQPRQEDPRKLASEFTFTAKWSVLTHFRTVSWDLLATGKYITLASFKKGPCMTKYNLEGKQLETVELSNNPKGMTEVILAQIPCLAVVTGSEGERKIVFDDIENLEKIVTKYDLEAAYPGAPFVASPGNLGYLDEDLASNKPCVRWVTCYPSGPKPAEPLNTTIFRGEGGVSFAVHAQHENRNLLITTDCFDEISAYDAETGEQVWHNEGAFPGMNGDWRAFRIATDGRGHVFVVDVGNNRKTPGEKEDRIQMFSTSGQYMGRVLQDEDLGEIFTIDWCDAISSLIVSHEKTDEENHRLSAFRIE